MSSRLLPLKNCREDSINALGMTRLKHPLVVRRQGDVNTTLTPPTINGCGVVVRRGGTSSGVVLVTWQWFKITRFVTKIPLAAEQRDVNIHSLNHSPAHHQVVAVA
ncbi:hypothetical protein TNCV_2512431 [Trichonephila clavipes]|nr:hypothetical protein TNCV_2512431 [Trichonephila clavipes]